MPDAMCPRNAMIHIIEEPRICTALTSFLTDVTRYLNLHFNDHTIDKSSAKLKFKLIFLDGKWTCKILVYETISELTSFKRQIENLYYSKVFFNLDTSILKYLIKWKFLLLTCLSKITEYCSLLLNRITWMLKYPQDWVHLLWNGDQAEIAILRYISVTN